MLSEPWMHPWRWKFSGWAPFWVEPGGLPPSLDISGGETKEFGLGLFLMLYLLSLHLALRAGQERSPQG